jgi:hypothetical protein
MMADSSRRRSSSSLPSMHPSRSVVAVSSLAVIIVVTPKMKSAFAVQSAA